MGCVPIGEGLKEIVGYAGRRAEDLRSVLRRGE